MGKVDEPTDQGRDITFDNKPFWNHSQIFWLSLIQSQGKNFIPEIQFKPKQKEIRPEELLHYLFITLS